MARRKKSQNRKQPSQLDEDKKPSSVISENDRIDSGMDSSHLDNTPALGSSRTTTYNNDDNNKTSSSNRDGASVESSEAASTAKESDPSTGKINPPLIINAASSGEESQEEGGDASVFGDDDYNSGMYRGLRGRRYCLSTLRFFAITIFLWISQYFLTHSLGILQGGEVRFDFDPSGMAQNYLPQQLQETFGQFTQLQRRWDSMFNESLTTTYITQKSQRPGFLLAEQGATAHYPVVMIPGFVTSGLEVWKSRECAKKYFRQKIWTGMESAMALLTDRHCWREHIALDPITGKDPEGIQLRASEGFDAADYFIANYWVWEKLLENLSDLGYNPTTMTMEPYDWRLAFPLLEERDGYLTKLKYKIEAMHKTNGKKVVLTSHSMGAQMVHFFFKWVTTPEREGGGGGGRKWVDQHIHAYVNIAGSHLGVPKAASALLSGEMNDLCIMGPIGQMLEQFFGRKLRKDLYNTWGSLWGMLPKGSDRIWDTGADVCYNVTDSSDDPFCKFRGDAVAENDAEPSKPQNHIPLLLLKAYEESKSNNNENNGLRQRDIDQIEMLFDIPEAENDDSLNVTVSAFEAQSHHTTASVLAFLRKWGAGFGPALSSSKLYSDYGNTKIKQRNKAKVEWLDTTLTPLPHAPKMKIYCMYGVGVDTERAYFYKVNKKRSRSTKRECELEGDNPGTRSGTPLCTGRRCG